MKLLALADSVPPSRCTRCYPALNCKISTATKEMQCNWFISDVVVENFLLVVCGVLRLLEVGHHMAVSLILGSYCVTVSD